MVRVSKGCRDCKRCTELGIKSLGMFPVRAAVGMVTLGIPGLFQRKCPHCGHKMSEHKLEDKIT